MLFHLQGALGNRKLIQNVFLGSQEEGSKGSGRGRPRSGGGTMFTTVIMILVIIMIITTPGLTLFLPVLGTEPRTLVPLSHSLCPFILFYLLSQGLTQAVFKLTVLLPQPPQVRHMSPNPGKVLIVRLRI